jgi:hypothetical protein
MEHFTLAHGAMTFIAILLWRRNGAEREETGSRNDRYN